MSSKKTIGIREVLATIRSADSQTQSFRLVFVRNGNAKRGSIKVVQKAIYGGRGQIKDTKSDVNHSRGLHKDNDTIPITDIENDDYLTPLISHIIGFENLIVRH